MVKSLSGLHRGDGSLTFTHRPIFKAHLVVAFGKNLCYPLTQVASYRDRCTGRKTPLRSRWIDKSTANASPKWLGYGSPSRAGLATSNLGYPLRRNNHSCCDKAISVHLDLI